MKNLICLQCQKEFIPSHRGQQGRLQKFCNLSCNMLWQHAHGRPKYYKRGLEPTKHPTTIDIGWAAGVYEGEGCGSTRNSWGGKTKTQQVAVGQKERWLCDRLREYFGGYVNDGGIIKVDRVVGKINYKGTHRGYTWHVHGPRARGFMMTVYPFLSSRRQLKIRELLGI